MRILTVDLPDHSTAVSVQHEVGAGEDMLPEFRLYGPPGPAGGGYLGVALKAVRMNSEKGSPQSAHVAIGEEYEARLLVQVRIVVPRWVYSGITVSASTWTAIPTCLASCPWLGKAGAEDEQPLPAASCPAHQLISTAKLRGRTPPASGVERRHRVERTERTSSSSMVFRNALSASCIDKFTFKHVFTTVLSSAWIAFGVVRVCNQLASGHERLLLQKEGRSWPQGHGRPFLCLKFGKQSRGARSNQRGLGVEAKP